MNVTPFRANEEQHKLQELLPYDVKGKKGMHIVKCLNEYRLLLEASLATIKALSEKNFVLFDALVGDNFCQSRALKVALCAPRCRMTFAKKEGVISKAIEDIETNYSKKKGAWFASQGLFLKEILEKNIDIVLTEDELFFVISYLLTIVKVVKFRDNSFLQEEKTDVKQLRTITLASKDFYDTLVPLLKKKLASLSVEFIKNLASSYGEAHTSMHGAQNIVIHNKLPCLHFYWGTKLIMKKALAEKIPIVIWTQQISTEKDKLIRDICLYYEPWKSLCYSERKPSLSDLGMPVMVIKGITCRDKNRQVNKRLWSRSFKLHGFDEIISASVASHRPFPGAIPDTTGPLGRKEIDHHISKAEKWGCTRDKSELFTIFHIYSDKLESIPEFKYIINAHLQKYHPFYKEKFLAEIQKQFTSAEPILEGTTVKFKNLTASICKSLESFLQQHSFFMISPMLMQKKENHLEVNLVIDDINNFYIDLLSYAKTHGQPVQFLLDHQCYWSFRRREIISFLISRPEHFENQELIESLFEFMKECEAFDLESKKQALLGIGRAIISPSQSQKAKAFLMDFEYAFEPEARKCAWQQLLPLIDEEDVQSFFRKVANEEPVLSLRFEARSYVDKAIFSKEEFNLQLFGQMILMAKKMPYETDLEQLIVLLNIVTLVTPVSFENLSGAYGELFAKETLELQQKTNTLKIFQTFSHSAEITGMIMERNEHLSLGKFERMASKICADALRAIFVDKEDSFRPAFRLLALRSFLPYFSYEPELGWTEEMHKIFKARNDKLAHRIYPSLEKLATSKTCDPLIKKEALYLLNLIADKRHESI